MSIRFYVLPLEISTNGARHPKYLPISFYGYAGDPLLVGTRWALQDYGLEPTAFFVLDATDAQHDVLRAYPDVDIFPLNLDAALGVNLETVRGRMEAWNIPGQWLTASSTYRELARAILGIFHFGQRFHSIGFTRLFPVGVTLNTQYGNLPNGYRAAFDQVVADRNLDRTGLTDTTTMRAILRALSQQQAPESMLGVTL